MIPRGVGGEDHIHPLLGVLGGVAKVIGKQIEAGVGADLVDVCDLQGLPLEIRHQAQVRGADDGRAVGVKADGVEVGGGGAEDAVRDHNAQGVSCGHDKVVTVDAAENAAPVLFQGLGHGGDGLLVRDGAAEAHHGGDAVRGLVSDIIFRPQVGTGGTPHDFPRKRGVVTNVQGVSIDFPAQSIRGQSRGTEQDRAERQCSDSSKDGFHKRSPLRLVLVGFLTIKWLCRIFLLYHRRKRNAK